MLLLLLNLEILQLLLILFFLKMLDRLIFGPKRFTEPALKLNEIPKIDLFLLTHNHYDHQDMKTIRRFPFKNSKVMVPLKLGKYFKTNGYRDINEMDWYDEIKVNKNLKDYFSSSCSLVKKKFN